MSSRLFFFTLCNSWLYSVSFRIVRRVWKLCGLFQKLCDVVAIIFAFLSVSTETEGTEEESRRWLRAIDFIPRVAGVFASPPSLPLWKVHRLAIRRRYFGGGVGNMLTLFIYKVAASALIKSWKSRGGRRTEGKERGGEKSTAIFQKAAM